MYYATSVALETDVIIQRVLSNSTVPGKTPISATPFLLFLFLHLFSKQEDSPMGQVFPLLFQNWVQL